MCEWCSDRILVNCASFWVLKDSWPTTPSLGWFATFGQKSFCTSSKHMLKIFATKKRQILAEITTSYIDLKWFYPIVIKFWLFCDVHCLGYIIVALLGRLRCKRRPFILLRWCRIDINTGMPWSGLQTHHDMRRLTNPDHDAPAEWSGRVTEDAAWLGWQSVSFT